MYYKDDFNVTFEEESAFYKYLDDVEKRAEWFRAQSKDLTVEAVTKDSTCTPIGNINLEYLKEDTINNSGLLIKTPDRSCFLGISAIKSLKGTLWIPRTQNHSLLLQNQRSLRYPELLRLTGL